MNNQRVRKHMPRDNGGLNRTSDSYLDDQDNSAASYYDSLQ